MSDIRDYISYDQNTGKFKWLAFAPCNYLNRNEKKQKYIGRFDTQESAHNAVVVYCGGM